MLGILNQEIPLENIENGRLIRLKEKTLGWRFQVIHIPGAKIGGPDALSQVSGNVNALEADAVMNRHFENQMLEVAEDRDGVKGMFASLRVSACPADALNGEDAILSEAGLEVKSMTWEDVQFATKKDPTSLKLKQ